MLSDRVVVIAGGGRGIGRATAQELAEAGATVVVNDLGSDLTGEGESNEPAAETVELVESSGGEAMAHFGDISSMDYADRLVEDTLDEYGRIDGAVNFAGILRDSMSFNMTGEEWDQVIRVHLRGHFALFKHLAATWHEKAKAEGLDTQRSFLSVSSGAAQGNVGQINYSAAKAGILGLTRSGAREFDALDDNVRVNAILPAAYTRLVSETWPDPPFDEEEMSPEHVASFVAFLMSDAAEDITGCSFRVQGEYVGLVSDPEDYKAILRDGGWSLEELSAKLHRTLGVGENLSKTDIAFAEFFEDL